MRQSAEGRAGAGEEVLRSRRHLLDVAGFGWEELRTLLREIDHAQARIAAPDQPAGALQGKRIATLFYEASTRTRVSFEVAAKNLSADVVNIATATSSVTKGESFLDTLRTIEALGAGMLVLRHSFSGAPYLAAEAFHGSVLNGGDGWHAHPTQALLDLYTMREHLDGSVAGRKVVILGDVLHSRVARSNIWSLTAAGADLWICGPATLLRGFEAWAGSGAGPAARHFTVTSDVDAALRDADVVMALRLQQERMSGGLLPSLREYAARFGLTRERLAGARPGALVMHPGPINEGVEIAPDVAEGVQSVIAEQVANGVAVRMAVLYLLAGARGGRWRERGRTDVLRG